MGWDCEFHALFHKADGRVDRRACLDHILTWVSYDSANHRTNENAVVRSSMVGTTYYAAIRRTYYDGRPAQVWGAVALTCGRGRDGTEWGYKLMDETQGPSEDDCPASILRLLTPIDSDYANDWRRRCAAKFKACGIRISSDVGEQLLLAI